MQIVEHCAEQLNSVMNVLGRRALVLHLSIWFLGLVVINMPNLNITVGLFNSQQNTLLISTLYALPINIALFYLVILSISSFLTDGKSFPWRYLISLLVGISLFETALDSLYWVLLKLPLTSDIIVELLVTNILLNFMLFCIPGFILGSYYALKNRHVEKSELGIELIDGAQKHRIIPSELIFAKSDGNYCELSFDDRTLTLRTTLSSLLATLPNYCVQCHRSYIVNRNKILRTNYNSIVLTNAKIPLGRTFSDKIRVKKSTP